MRFSRYATQRQELARGHPLRIAPAQEITTQLNTKTEETGTTVTASQLQREHQEAIARYGALNDRLRSAAAAEGRELGPGETDAINQAVFEANRIKQRLDRETQRLDRDTRGDAAFRTALAQIMPTTSGRPSRRDSLGRQFLDSETFAWLREHRGHLPVGAWTSPSSELSGVGDMLAATLTEDPASG